MLECKEVKEMRGSGTTVLCDIWSETYDPELLCCTLLGRRCSASDGGIEQRPKVEKDTRGIFDCY